MSMLLETAQRIIQEDNNNQSLVAVRALVEEELEKLKDTLVTTHCEVMMGKAQMCKLLLKRLAVQVNVDL